MFRIVAWVALLLFAFSIAGCAVGALDMAPNRPDGPWAAPTTSAGEIVPGARTSPDEPEATYVLPRNGTLAIVPPPVSELERHRPYSLAGLIDVAQSNNPTTRNAWNDAREAALAVGISESALLPVLSAGIVQGWQQSHNQNSALGSNVTNDLTANGNIEVLSAEWLLFDFGERAALIDVAKQQSVISNIAFTSAHQQVIYNVSSAFYAHAAARARLASAARSRRDADAVLVAANDRYKRGIGTVVEVAQTRQAAAEARLAQVQAQGATQNSYLALISALGISPTTRLAVPDVSHRPLPASLPPQIKHFVAEALARRPDVLTGYAGLQASLAGLRAAQAEFLPKVFFAGNATRLAGSLSISALPGIGQQLPIVNLPNSVGVSGTQFGATALVGATMPIYDGGNRLALLEQARDRVDKAQTTLDQLRNEALRQIIQAENTLQTSLSAYSASKALSAAAQTTFDAALSAYKNGVGSITDVTTAERQLLAAKDSATDAYSTALSSAATLALAGGMLGSAPGQ